MLLAVSGLLGQGVVAAPPALAAVDSGFEITDKSSASAEDLARELLSDGVEIFGSPVRNGAAEAFGTFVGGSIDIGIDEGLIIGANARATSFVTSSVDATVDADAANEEDPALEALLLTVDDLCDSAAQGDCVNNPTGLEFSVVPTARYLKFEYVLAITETGDYDEADEAWSGEVFEYPDGFGLFVGGTQPTDNCAAIPTTSTYISMETAGIVPPSGERETNRTAAQANLEALVAGSLDASPAPGIAYPAEDDDWDIQFLTVPLTCVVDLGTTLPASVPIKIVIADANDGEVPPAVFLAGNSVRFGVTDTPTVEDEVETPVVEDDDTTPVVRAAEAAAEELTGVSSVLVRGSDVVTTTTTVSPDAGPTGGMVIEDEDGTMTVTVTTPGSATSSGVVVPESGEFFCEICARLAAGSVVEAWVYSEPRLTAAVRVEVGTDDSEEETCPFLRIPLGGPLDGGAPIEPGVHTVQLRMYTENGLEVLAFPITVGGPIPTSVPTGEGPLGTSSGTVLLLASLAGIGLLTGIRLRTRRTHGAA